MPRDCLRGLVALGILASFASAAFAADPADVPTIEAIARNCMGCHGIEGRSPADIPSIAGKDAEWMARRLAAFRSGAAESTIMGRIMKPFADEDIRAISVYFAGRK